MSGNTDISALILTLRSENGLRSVGINTIEQLLKADIDTFKAMKNVGKKGVTEILFQFIALNNERLAECATACSEIIYKDDNIAELKEKARKYDKISRITQV